MRAEFGNVAAGGDFERRGRIPAMLRVERRLAQREGGGRDAAKRQAVPAHGRESAWIRGIQRLHGSRVRD